MAKKTRVRKTNARKRKTTMKGGIWPFTSTKNPRERFKSLKMKLPQEEFPYSDYESFALQYVDPNQQERILREFEMKRGNTTTGFVSSVSRGIRDTAGSMRRGAQRWVSTPNSGPTGYRGIGPQNEGGLTGFTRGLRRGITDLMGNRNAKTRKSSFSNISRINTNTVASIAAKIDAILIYLGVPYLFTDNTYATNYIISRFNPGTQSNDGRGFLRLTEGQIRQIATYVDQSFGSNTQFNEKLLKQKMQEYQQKLEGLKQQITTNMKTSSFASGLGFGSSSGSGSGSGFGSIFGSSGGQEQPATQQQFNSLSNEDVSLLVEYMVVSTILNFMVDKLEKENKQGTFEINPTTLSTMIEKQISTQISQINPSVQVTTVPVMNPGVGAGEIQLVQPIVETPLQQGPIVETPLQEQGFDGPLQEQGFDGPLVAQQGFDGPLVAQQQGF